MSIWAQVTFVGLRKKWSTHPTDTYRIILSKSSNDVFRITKKWEHPIGSNQWNESTSKLIWNGTAAKDHFMQVLSEKILNDYKIFSWSVDSEQSPIKIDDPSIKEALYTVPSAAVIYKPDTDWNIF